MRAKDIGDTCHQYLAANDIFADDALLDRASPLWPNGSTTTSNKEQHAMPNGLPGIYRVFKDKMMTGVSQVNSDPVPMDGNCAVVTLLCQNITPANTLVVNLEGSYNGSTWVTVATSPTAYTVTGFGYVASPEMVKTACQFPLLRIKCNLLTSGTVLFDASLAFSWQ